MKKPETTFSYRQVEAALAKVFGAGSQTIPALRGRINGLQRKGLVPETPGRGKVIRYTINNVYDWGFALSFAEFGLPPRIIVNVVKPGIFQRFIAEMEKQVSLAHLFLVYYPSLFYETLDAAAEPIVYTTVWEDRLHIMDVGSKRYALIDLTDLKLRIDQALAPDSMSQIMSHGAAATK